jgi:hypothetical protein
METHRSTGRYTRRDWLRGAAVLTGGALAARFYPASLARAAAPGFPQKSAADQVAAMRAQFGGTPLPRRSSRTA